MKITIEILQCNALIKANYQSGRLRKLEFVRGKYSELQWNNLSKILPRYEKDIKSYTEQFTGKVIYTEVKEVKSLHGQFSEVWFKFYEAFTGFAPRFNIVEGKALKDITAYLIKIGGDEVQALQLWQALLDNWNKLDEFHQKNTDLKYINGNINKLLQNVKRNNQGAGANYSEDFQRRIVEDLQSG